MGLHRTITTPHQRVHEGVMFTVGYTWDGVADTNVVEYLVSVGSNKTLHSVLSAAGSGDFDLEIFEGTTTSADGTALTEFDHNRITANSSDAAFYRDPTVTADGTQLGPLIHLPGGAVGQGNKGSLVGAGGENTYDSEIIFKTSTKYLIRLTNVAGAASDLLVLHTFYENGI